MIAWTITVAPTVAPRTEEFYNSHITSSTIPQRTARGTDGEEEVNVQTEYRSLNTTGITHIASNAVSNYTLVGSLTLIETQGYWELGETEDTEAGGFSQSAEARSTLSWDGQFSFFTVGNTSTQTPTSATASRVIETTSSEALEVEKTTTTTTTASASNGTTVLSGGASVATTASKSVSETITTIGNGTIADFFLTTSSEAIVLWNNASGSRATATVLRLGANEVAWVPTTTSFGHELGAFCTSHSGTGHVTILPTPFFRSGQTYNGTATSGETVTLTSTVLTGTHETQSFQTGQVVPSTGTEQIVAATTSEFTQNKSLETLAFHSISASTTQWLDSTVALSLSTLTWQGTVKSYKTANTKVSTAASAGVSTESFSQTESIEDHIDGTTSLSTSREVRLTWSESIEPRLQALPTNAATFSAASFYKARSPLSALTKVARFVSAQGITYSEQQTALAAQTAVVPYPTTWTYVSSGTSFTASADAAGLFLTKDSGPTSTTRSKTTTSAEWATNQQPHITRATRTAHGEWNKVLPRAFSAATGTAMLFRPAGTYWTSNGTTSGSISYSQSTHLSNQSGREVSSIAKLWSVGAGEFYSVVERNLTAMPA